MNCLLQVLIAQEKMATNTVYVFSMKDGKYAYKCEIRSCIEHSARPVSTLWINMMARGGSVSTPSVSLILIMRSYQIEKHKYLINLPY